MAVTLYSRSAELTAIYTLCASPELKVANELFYRLSDKSFYYEEHQLLFAYIRQYAKKAPSESPFPSWSDLLLSPVVDKNQRKRLKTGVREIDVTTDPKTLAERLSSMAMARELGVTLDTIASTIQDGGKDTDLQELVSMAKKKIAGINDNVADFDDSIVSIGTDSEKTREMLEKILRPDSVPYIPTGFQGFDRRNRGLNLGSLTIMAGNTGTGKSLLAGQSSRNMAIRGHRVCFVGLEMTCIELMQREMARQAHIPLTEIINTEDMSDRTRRDIRAAYEKMNKTIGRRGGCLDYFSPTDDFSIEQILFGIAPRGYDAVFVDYIGLLGGLSGEDQWRAMKNATRFGKVFARNSNIALILLAQLTEDGSLRQSKGMKDDANYMWTWSMSAQDRESGTMNIRQEKNRSGPMEPFTLKVDWATMTVCDADREGELDEAVYQIGKDKADDYLPKVEENAPSPEAEESAETSNDPSVPEKVNWHTVDCTAEYPFSHDLHDMDFWYDEKLGVPPEWEELLVAGFIDISRLYGAGFPYDRSADPNPIGFCVIPPVLRKTVYPTDENGVPLFDERLDSYLTPEERRDMGFKTISLPEYQQLSSGDVPPGHFDSVLPAAHRGLSRTAYVTIESRILTRMWMKLYETAESPLLLNRLSDVMGYDPDNRLIHATPKLERVPRSAPITQLEGESDEAFAQRRHLSEILPYDLRLKEDPVGVLGMYSGGCSYGMFHDNPSQHLKNWHSAPEPVYDRLVDKDEPRTIADFGFIPQEVLGRFIYGEDAPAGYEFTPLSDSLPLSFPMTLHYDSVEGTEEFVTLNDSSELRYLLGVRWYDPDTMQEGEKYGWRPSWEPARQELLELSILTAYPMKSDRRVTYETAEEAGEESPHLTEAQEEDDYVQSADESYPESDDSQDDGYDDESSADDDGDDSNSGAGVHSGELEEAPLTEFSEEEAENFRRYGTIYPPETVASSRTYAVRPNPQTASSARHGSDDYDAEDDPDQDSPLTPSEDDADARAAKSGTRTPDTTSKRTRGHSRRSVGPLDDDSGDDDSFVVPEHLKKKSEEYNQRMAEEEKRSQEHWDEMRRKNDSPTKRKVREVMERVQEESQDDDDGPSGRGGLPDSDEGKGDVTVASIHEEDLSEDDDDFIPANEAVGNNLSFRRTPKDDERRSAQSTKAHRTEADTNTEVEDSPLTREELAKFSWKGSPVRHSIFHQLHLYRSGRVPEGFGNPGKMYGVQAIRERLTKEEMDRWRRQYNPKIARDLHPSKKFPIDRVRLTEHGKPLVPGTKISYPMPMEDLATGERQVIRNRDELLAMFNVRFILP